MTSQYIKLSEKVQSELFRNLRFLYWPRATLSRQVQERPIPATLVRLSGYLRQLNLPPILVHQLPPRECYKGLDEVRGSLPKEGRY